MQRVSILVLLMSSSTVARMLLPPNVYSANDIMENIEPVALLEPLEAMDAMDENAKEQHMRNCFFTPVQCLLPTTDSHKDVQSLHGVYNPSSAHVRRSVDNVLTSPLGFNDLYKRNGDNRIFQWLSRF